MIEGKTVKAYPVPSAPPALSIGTLDNHDHEIAYVDVYHDYEPAYLNSRNTFNTIASSANQIQASPCSQSNCPEFTNSSAASSPSRRVARVGFKFPFITIIIVSVTWLCFGYGITRKGQEPLLWTEPIL